MLEAYLKEIGVTNPEAIARNRRIAPKHLPAFHDLIIDDQGQIWVAVNTPEAVEIRQGPAMPLRPQTKAFSRLPRMR